MGRGCSLSQWIAAEAWCLGCCGCAGARHCAATRGNHLFFPSPPRCRYLDLTLGCLLPALVQAAAETRLYVQHCAERRRAGLPRERGWQARVHDELADLAQGLSWPQVAVMLWVALGIAFDLSLLAGR